MTRALLALGASVGLLLAGAAEAGPRASESLARGREVYERCAACHSLESDRVGPRHCGLLGRPAGSVPGFAYSEAMRRSPLVWDRATLDRFLADPLATVPGTSMGYAGIPDASEREALLVYLEAASRSDACAANGALQSRSGGSTR